MAVDLEPRSRPGILRAVHSLPSSAATDTDSAI